MSSIYPASKQAGRILAILRARDGTWVPLPEIMACAAQQNARIFELRRCGFTIENRTEKHSQPGACRSRFRLVNSPTTPPFDEKIPPADPNSDSHDWFQEKTGKLRAPEHTPDVSALGPLFQTRING
jgi:hypothetical protein